ncbi:MAG: hypothetical protein M3P84_08880 [Chloroflexota bacterium]|nr:hypothetical protein [Chloroflexota bacterium]
MNHADEATVLRDSDFFVVRQRIAEEQVRVRAENLANTASRATKRAGEPGRLGGPAAWLGRRLVAVGSVLTGDPPASATEPSTGQPC